VAVARIELFVALLVLVLEIYAVVNCILTPEGEVRGVHKAVWLIFIILLPLLGSVLWLGVGRNRPPRPAHMSGRAYDSGAAHRGRSGGYRDLDVDERIRRMEEDLARLERESGEDDDPAPRG
jgi:hypothetical protein